MQSALAKLIVVTSAVVLGAPCVVAARDLAPIVDEVRIGVAGQVNDRPVSGYAQFEGLLSPLPAVAAYDANLAWLLSPRPLVGASISLQGKTNEVYAGLAWRLPAFGPLFAEVSFGGLVHDQNLYQVYSDRPILTTRFLFRESMAIGYDIDETWRIVAFADHASNGNLGYGNRSINHVGVLLGAKFGRGGAAVWPPAIANVATFSWAGFYGGISAGTAIGALETTIEMAGAPSEITRQSGFSVSPGGYLGYNWVFGATVVGVETDLSAQRLVNSVSRREPTKEEVSVSSRWFASTRARLGVDLGGVPYVQRMLLYGTAGAAFAQAHKSWCNTDAQKCFINGDVAIGWLTEDGSRSGWTAGAGVELPIAEHTSVRLEYFYANFGSFSFVNPPLRNDIAFSQQIVRGGLSLGFVSP